MILLDTHVWIWWVSSPEELSHAAHESIENATLNNDLYLSSMSTLEIALLVARGRLKLAMDVEDWIRKSEALPFLKFIPVNNLVAVKSVFLPPPIHRDPADRIIIATAITSGAVLVTKDEKILSYPHVKTLW